MSTKRVHVDLECPTCGKASANEILYLGRLMLTIRCSSCGAEFTMHRAHLVQDWVTDLSARLAAKPQLLWDDARNDPRAFVRHLPRMVARQPGKLADELSTILAQRRRRAS